MDDYQELKQYLSILEQRIVDLEREFDENGAGGQNAAFVPIPQIGDELPWLFSAADGWTNGIAQFGYDRLFITPDLSASHSYRSIIISGVNQTDDGHHYLEVDTLNATAEIKVNQTSVPGHDPTHGILRIGIGFVSNGKLVHGIHYNPVVYTYV